MLKKTKAKKEIKKIKIKRPARKTARKLKAKPALATREFGLFNLKPPKGAHKKKRILGRGSSSGHGGTSTRGSKGQTSRTGRDFYQGFEGGQTPLIRRIPKRGFNNKFRKDYQVINLSDLARVKEHSITIALLQEKGLIRSKNKLVKVLGDGSLKRAVTVQAHAFSKNAIDQIEKAGGKAEVVSSVSLLSKDKREGAPSGIISRSEKAEG